MSCNYPAVTGMSRRLYICRELRYFMKINKQKIIVLCMILACITASGCGKEKVVDEESSKVIQISVAPVAVTPTPAPDQINADAVVTNGNLTMVNGYLAGQSSTDTSDTSGGSDISDTSGTEENSGE